MVIPSDLHLRPFQLHSRYLYTKRSSIGEGGACLWRSCNFTNSLPSNFREMLCAFYRVLKGVSNIAGTGTMMIISWNTSCVKSRWNHPISKFSKAPECYLYRRFHSPSASVIETKGLCLHDRSGIRERSAARLHSVTEPQGALPSFLFQLHGKGN